MRGLILAFMRLLLFLSLESATDWGPLDLKSTIH